MADLTAVNEIVAAKKRIVRAMAWSKKPNRQDIGWYDFTSAVEDLSTGVVFEEMYVRALWRPRIDQRPAVLSFGLHLQNERIFAVDVAPFGIHKNVQAGKGRPYYRMEIGGIHEHTMSADGYGYAEPIEGLTETDVAASWRYFCQRANLEPSGNFVHPDTAVDAGQLGLLP